MPSGGGTIRSRYRIGKERAFAIAIPYRYIVRPNSVGMSEIVDIDR